MTRINHTENQKKYVGKLQNLLELSRFLCCFIDHRSEWDNFQSCILKHWLQHVLQQSAAQKFVLKQFASKHVLNQTTAHHAVLKKTLILTTLFSNIPYVQHVVLKQLNARNMLLHNIALISTGSSLIISISIPHLGWEGDWITNTTWHRINRLVPHLLKADNGLASWSSRKLLLNLRLIVHDI